MIKNHPAFSATSRRRFLGLTGTIAAGAALGAFGSSARAADGAATTTTTAQPAKKKIPIGLELYSVRNALQRDLPGTLRAVAKAGYEVVEFFSPYFAWKYAYAKEVRVMLDDLGMKCWSTHNSGAGSITAGETMAHAIELNQIIGAKILVQASPPRGAQGLEGWKRICEQFTGAAGALAPHGLAAGFHNHAAEWAKIDGEQRIMDVIAANTPPEFVLQLDVGTCVAAGADPVAWIKSHPGRIRSVHLKDWAPGPREDEKDYRVLFREGVAPWKEIVEAAESVGGVEYYLMEQEGSRYSEFETAERCIAAWKELRASA